MTPCALRLPGADGLTLAADAFGPDDGDPVLLLHGGGQTRHAWGEAARTLGAEGYRALAIDARGHSDSDWSADGDYGPDAFVRDLAALIAPLDKAAILVGASLGGVASLLAVGEGVVRARSLVLVDITPRVNEEGSAKIGAFMKSAPDGFASLDEAADAVAKYLPHRPRPKDVSGLAKNLRRGEDGRYRWHWDPRFIDDANQRISPIHTGDRLREAARNVRIPTLLVRGALSEIVTDESVSELRALIPHAAYVNVAEAGHMVAGDKNTAFLSAVRDFIAGLSAPEN